MLHLAPVPDTGLERGDTELCVRGDYDDASTGETYRFIGCAMVTVVR